VTPSNALAWVDTAYHYTLDGIPNPFANKLVFLIYLCVGIFFSANNDQIWFCEYVGVSDPDLNHPFYMSFVWNVSDTLVTGYAEGGCSYQTRVSPLPPHYLFDVSSCFPSGV
jgi:hypothetical protein